MLDRALISSLPVPTARVLLRICSALNVVGEYLFIAGKNHGTATNGFSMQSELSSEGSVPAIALREEWQ